jgi:hypothetical protein
VHGHILLGGYGDYTGDRFFALRNPLVGLLTVLGPMVGWTLPLWSVAVRAGRRGLAETLALWLPAVAFLATFSNPEPERRLAPLIAAWTVALVTRAAPSGPGERLTLSALCVASGLIGLSSDFVDTVSTPLGLYSGPRLELVRLSFAKGQPGLATAIVVFLASTIVLAGSRTLGQMLRGPARVG